MRIRKEWNEALSHSLITEDMLEAAVLSISQREQNWHRKKLEYSRWHHTEYDYAAKAAAHEMEMRERKEILLSISEPVCIHKVFRGYASCRIRGCDPDYAVRCGRAACQGLIIRKGSFQEKDESDDFPSFIPFADIEDKTREKNAYYLYYLIGSRGFYRHMEEKDYRTYEHLPVVFTGELKQAPMEEDIASVQFVRKLLNMIHDHTFIYQKKLTRENGMDWKKDGISEAEYKKHYRQAHLFAFAEDFFHEILEAMREEVHFAYQEREGLLSEAEKMVCRLKAEKNLLLLKKIQLEVRAHPREKQLIREWHRMEQQVENLPVPVPYEACESDPSFQEKLMRTLSIDRTIHDLVTLLPDEQYARKRAERDCIQRIMTERRYG